MADCLFCRIATGEIPSHTLYESSEAFAFLDIHPRAPGHAMVIPKHHAGNIIELPAEDLEPLFKGVREVVSSLDRALKPVGFTIGVNHGRKAGQEIDHFHVHVIPRFEGDGGKSIQAVVSNVSTESLEEIAKKIRKA